MVKYFIVKELLAAIEKTELICRSKSDWFGGVDCHHVYFEGLILKKNGNYKIVWGS